MVVGSFRHLISKSGTTTKVIIHVVHNNNNNNNEIHQVDKKYVN